MWFYNFGLLLYVWAIRLVAPRHQKARLWLEGRKDLFRRMREAIDPSARIVWVHVASLGEFEQGRPIIEQIRKTRPEYKILVTFFSPSGYEIRKNYKGADYIFYLPLDTPRNARRFLDIARPEIAIFVKYEFWLNLLRELRRRLEHTFFLVPGYGAQGATGKDLAGCFDAAGNGKTYVAEKLEDSHGLLWDPAAGVLWAVGRTVLTAYEVTFDGGKITVTERRDLRTAIPSDWAHDLQPYYGNTDRMWVTTGSAVYVYSKSQKKFLTDYPGAAKIQRKNVKGIGNFEDGSVVLITPDGGFKTWTGP